MIQYQNEIQKKFQEEVYKNQQFSQELLLKEQIIQKLHESNNTLTIQYYNIQALYQDVLRSVKQQPQKVQQQSKKVQTDVQEEKIQKENAQEEKVQEQKIQK
jgi:hypothetical protein